ncbi:HTTM domain-containing protein [Curtobacterium sp. MR_MD2014]|uniref:HTTM domain-containing protein n=1 Tax=Curtobacterium sp. MR_MD2014 TaxID=1561023 RepID=UPI00130DCC00|nr:HTTM domain-containing protein [Curtobacterium sp. MR_MD2014]
MSIYVGQYSDRLLLFGPDGVYGTAGIRDSAASIGTWSLYGLSEDPWVFELLFHAGLVIAVLVMLGVGGRALLAVHWVLIWPLYMANPGLMDGGDALASTATCFLLLTRCYSAFTVRRIRSEPVGVIASVCNNTGLLLLVTQVVVVYLMAGLYKVQGQLWQDGIALYYILSVPEFFLPGVTPFVLQSDWVLVIGAYATVLASVFFPVLVLFRQGRPLAVAVMLTFHLAIAVLMGLTSFALVMAAYDLLFVNHHVVRLRRRAALLRRALAGCREETVDERSVESTATLAGEHRRRVGLAFCASRQRAVRKGCSGRVGKYHQGTRGDRCDDGASA